MKNTKPTTWKYEYHNKNNPIDIVLDLFDDTTKHLHKSKYIQDIKNFFKKITTVKYKDKPGYIKLNKQNVFNQIRISEIQEIKIEQKQIINNKVSKKKQVITEQTEPSIAQVVAALNKKTDYAKIITDSIVNGIMFIFIVIVGFFEIIRYLIRRLVIAIKYLLGLPYREAIRIVSKILLYGGSVACIIIAIGFAQSMYLNQKTLESEQQRMIKYVDDRSLVLEAKIETLQNTVNYLNGNAVITEHKIINKEYQDRFGRIIKREKIR